MTLRPAAFATSLALTALVLTGCTPAPAPTGSPAPTDSASASPVATEEPVVQLPDDALLSITMTATAIATGAQLEIQLVLLKPEPSGSGPGVERAAATVAHCPDEIDQNVVTSNNYSFGQLDVTATPVDGTAAWPHELALHLQPGEGGGASLATGGGAYQVERPNELNEEAFYVPYCSQDAFLDVPGNGSVYLGWDSDATTLDRWASTQYGATFDLWGEPIGDPPVQLSECEFVLTDLGKSMGGFTIFPSDSQCIAVPDSP